MAWRKESRGSKRGSTEELELDRIETVEVIGDEEAKESLERTVSNKSSDSLGSSGSIGELGRLNPGERKRSKKKSVCSTLSNTSEQVAHTIHFSILDRFGREKVQLKGNFFGNS